MIHLYDPGHENFQNNGDVILTPVSGSHKQVAGGAYDLTMVHPIDPEGKWAHLVPDAIIKAPVPKETIETAFSGMDVDVYKTNQAAALRSGPNEPSTITYGGWSAGTVYSVGAKVSYNNKNYQCTSFDESSGYIMVPPPNSPWWVEIARTRPGDPVLVNLKSGADLYYVSGPSSGVYYMSTPYGLEGYINGNYISYNRHLTPEETQPRTIKDQLFRIRTVTVDTKEMRVTVNAQHVSYDLNGVLIDRAKIVRKPPAQALAWLESAFMIDYRGTIATNMVSNVNAEYTAEIAGKSGMYAILDPDQGVVPTFDAEFRRDNWDLFVMNKTNTDRGFRIRYGNNMRGVNWKVQGDKLVTRVVPVAKAADGSDLYLEPTRWVDSSRIGNYPVIRMERLKVQGQVGKDDGTETATNWTAVTLRAEMQKQAEARFSVDRADQIQHEITVDFEMLGDTAEHPELKQLQQVVMYDTVIIIDERVGLGASVTVNEIEFDIIKEKITALKLTNVNPYNVKNVSGFNVLVNTITGDKLTDDAGDEIRDEAVDIAQDFTEEYATHKKQEAIKAAADYTDETTETAKTEAIAAAAENVGSNHGYATFEAYIKAYCDDRYEKK